MRTVPRRCCTSASCPQRLRWPSGSTQLASWRAAFHAGTGDSERRDTLTRFADGSVTVVVNVFTMTEGIDVPRVSTIVLSRTCGHVSTYMQIVGRALRTHPGKARALLLDLTGVANKHGMPTDDREFSLNGAGIGEPQEREQAEREARASKVLGVEMVTLGGAPAAAVEAAPDPKRARWDALAAEVEADRMGALDAIEAYRAGFGEEPPWATHLSPRVIAAERAPARSSMSPPYPANDSITTRHPSRGSCQA
jgi:hypothetical protein